jgi:dephospho-CoA kinase
VLTPVGLDRAKMLSLLSGSPKKKAKLEKMIHPLVYKEILAKVDSMTSGKVVLDVPLLNHSPLEEITDLIIYVAASEKKQIARLVERGKDPKASLELNRHYPRALLRKKAGIVLSTDGSLKELYHQLDRYPFL